MNIDQEGGGGTNLEILGGLASPAHTMKCPGAEVSRSSHIDGKTSLKQLHCRKKKQKLCSQELTDLPVQTLKQIWPLALLHVTQWPRTNFWKSSSN